MICLTQWLTESVWRHEVCTLLISGHKLSLLDSCFNLAVQAKNSKTYHVIADWLQLCKSILFCCDTQYTQLTQHNSLAFCHKPPRPKVVTEIGISLSLSVTLFLSLSFSISLSFSRLLVPEILSEASQCFTWFWGPSFGWRLGGEDRETDLGVVSIGVGGENCFN